jgi:hypothetical protein
MRPSGLAKGRPSALGRDGVVESLPEEQSQLLCCVEELLAAAIPTGETGPKLPVKLLFLGPFALESIVRIRAQEWAEQPSASVGADITTVVADPLYDVATEVESKGYWLRPWPVRTKSEGSCSANRSSTGW